DGLRLGRRQALQLRGRRAEHLPDLECDPADRARRLRARLLPRLPDRPRLLHRRVLRQPRLGRRQRLGERVPDHALNTALFGVAPIVGGIGAAVWVLVFAICRYASVASIAAALSLPVASVALGEPWPVDVFAGAAALAVLVLHRPNIARLRAGTETRFRFRRGAVTS